MDDLEAAEVLALAITLDPYRLGNPSDEGPRPTELDTLIEAWALSMPDVDGRHAKRAVVEHYRSSGKRITISDVIDGATRIATQDRAQARAEALSARREADRRALPAPAPVKPRDVRALIARFRNWDPVGDLGVRRSQARWHPDLDRAYREALRQSAQQDQDPA